MLKEIFEQPMAARDVHNVGDHGRRVGDAGRARRKHEAELNARAGRFRRREPVAADDARVAEVGVAPRFGRRITIRVGEVIVPPRHDRQRRRHAPDPVECVVERSNERLRKGVLFEGIGVLGRDARLVGPGEERVLLDVVVLQLEQRAARFRGDAVDLPLRVDEASRRAARSTGRESELRGGDRGRNGGQA